MFELSIIKKYLLPSKKQLSVSLITCLSLLVISLVVWLVLVFLSVTEGIEQNWLKKLTVLNPPLRITPTPAYYSSYYYQIDSISSKSSYSLKSIGEKLQSLESDPYYPEEDVEIPKGWPLPIRDEKNNQLKDIVKETYLAINDLQKQFKDIQVSDFEIGGALLHLSLLRPSAHDKGLYEQSSLSQVVYLSSFPEKGDFLTPLLLKPTVSDINHLVSMSRYLNENEQNHYLQSIFSHITHYKLLIKNNAFLPSNFLPEDKYFPAIAKIVDNQIDSFLLTTKSQLQPVQLDSTQKMGRLIRRKNAFYFEGDKQYKASLSIPIFLNQKLDFLATLLPSSLITATNCKEIQFQASIPYKKEILQGVLSWKDIELSQVEILNTFSSPPPIPPPWIHWICSSNESKGVLPKKDRELGVLLPLAFKTSGVNIGDRGHLSYVGQTANSIQEQKIPIYTAGFYDPGPIFTGAKYLFVPKGLAYTINSCNSSFSLDSYTANGFGVWFSNLKQAETIKYHIQRVLREANLNEFWQITSFTEYDFAKDLLQQFQSDKYLFILIAIIILIVACSNVISLLILLVNDKKQEIGILSAMGAPKKSIVAIFSLCGMLMGISSSIFGSIAAFFTLKHIDKLATFLSFLQGHEAFHSTFYGDSLPNQFSLGALLFILFLTPLLSLLAGLVPAIKACKLDPTQILRSK